MDAPVERTTSQSAAIAQELAVFVELERRSIGKPTQTALTVRWAQAVRLDRPRSVPADVVSRILALQRSGAKWAAIASELNTENGPTAQCRKRWYLATIRLAATEAGLAA
jgi:hypothetical protein